MSYEAMLEKHGTKETIVNSTVITSRQVRPLGSVVLMVLKVFDSSAYKQIIICTANYLYAN